MIERKTSIGLINIEPQTGNVMVRLHVQLFEDGAPIGAPQYHRTSVIEPDMDIDAHMAEVNADLSARKIGPLMKDWSDIHAHAKVARKPEIVAAHKAAKEKRRAEEEARQQAMAAERAKAQGSTPAHPVPGLGGLPT